MDNKVLAIVKNKEIRETDIEELISKYPEGERKKLSTEEGRRKLLDKLISCEVMYDYAIDENLQETIEYKKQLEEAEKGILTEMAINKSMGKVDITEEDALNYYNNNIEKFYVSDTVSIKQILVDTLEEALKIRGELMEEVINFSDAALKYSMCPSSINGGSLGTFKRGQLIKSIEEKAFNCKLGEILGPIETEYGFHLVVTEDYKEGYKQEFDDVKKDLVNELKKKEQMKNYKSLVEKINKKYKVQKFV
ncbi:peptidil-prolyl cis-trans isomerase [Clostridium bornimense]|uniref:Peptidil-prolyl cis-trans isomerase n=1 Tax=Clostridium bornimense TaxID=1216932 RepID=W6SK87_9CLOT|nr:peptidylprolyl isomerase [Clostridium bornimense]CDM70235.1 peptidil-prolyl cis-trans isomerase [Clostridium bornimense]